MARALVVLALLLIGCTEPTSKRFSVTGTLGEKIPGTDLWLWPRPPTVGIESGDRLLAKGPLATGTTLEVPLEGRRCTVAIVYVGTSTSTDYNPATKQPTARDLRTRSSPTFTAELTCSDGPLPGAKPTLDSRPALPWLLPGLLLGVLAGVLWGHGDAREAKMSTIFLAFATVLAALVLAVIVGVARFEAGFQITFTILAVGFAAAGIFTGVVWFERKRSAIGSLIGAAAGVGAIAIAYPTWTVAAPLGALLAAAAGWLVAVVATALIGK
ncbi:MAG: hypothetical protein ABI867_13560 [Kofleriaceae bacterium]